MGKGGTINRLEHNNSELCDCNVGLRFKSAGWYEFIKKFSGENYGVSKTFALSFNGVKVQVGGVGFKVTEQSMAKALSLPHTGERWYKGQDLGATDLNFFLKPEHNNPSWKRGPKGLAQGRVAESVDCDAEVLEL